MTQRAVRRRQSTQDDPAVGFWKGSYFSSRVIHQFSILCDRFPRGRKSRTLSLQRSAWSRRGFASAVGTCHRLDRVPSDDAMTAKCNPDDSLSQTSVRSNGGARYLTIQELAFFLNVRSWSLMAIKRAASHMAQKRKGKSSGKSSLCAGRWIGKMSPITIWQHFAAGRVWNRDARTGS